MSVLYIVLYVNVCSAEFVVTQIAHLQGLSIAQELSLIFTCLLMVCACMAILLHVHWMYTRLSTHLLASFPGLRLFRLHEPCDIFRVTENGAGLGTRLPIYSLSCYLFAGFIYWENIRQVLNSLITKSYCHWQS